MSRRGADGNSSCHDRAEVRRLAQLRTRSAHTFKLSTVKLQEATLIVWCSKGNIESGLDYLEDLCAAQEKKHAKTHGPESLSPLANRHLHTGRRFPTEWGGEMLEESWAARNMDDEIAILLLEGALTQ